jgi:bacterioferritin-associated ferredoxin
MGVRNSPCNCEWFAISSFQASVIRRAGNSFVYVCICNGYRERELRDVVLQGARNVKEAYRALGNDPCCGCCVEDAQSLIEETLSACACAAE